MGNDWSKNATKIDKPTSDSPVCSGFPRIKEAWGVMQEATKCDKRNMEKERGKTPVNTNAFAIRSYGDVFCGLLWLCHIQKPKNTVKEELVEYHADK